VAENEVEELARQRYDLRLILDAIPGFVFYKDINNRILRVNRAVADSLGVQADDMVNTETSRWYPDEASRYYEDDLTVIAGGQPKLGIVEQLETDHGKRWISTDKFPQRDRDGRIIGIVVIAQDITERRRLEEDLLQSQKLDSIGRLAGGVAHDFNNLLTAILGHVELAQKTVEPDSPPFRHLDVIRMAAERSSDLTRQLLAFARKQVIAPRALDLGALSLQGEILLQRVFPETISLQVARGATPLWVNADPGQMLQVLMNLALNARDATPPGGVVALSVNEYSVAVPGKGDIPPGEYVVLTISDSGHGLSDEAKRHLFEPFFTTKEVGTGTGLGLAVCYGIVKQNRGHITVQSGGDERHCLSSVFATYSASCRHQKDLQ
jgi:two-component system, cell cycle sensor histidine kinase and response regulator CckA